MSKPWKQSHAKPAKQEELVSLAESKIFGAELSGNAPSVDLHGMHVEAAVHVLDLFLHTEFMRHTDVIKIIHGRGSGTLREAVHVFLRAQTLVETYRDGRNPSEILGVTYAVLRGKA